MSDSYGAYWSIRFTRWLKIVANIYLRVKLWKIVFETFTLTIAKSTGEKVIFYSFIPFKYVFNIRTHDLRSSLQTNALEIFSYIIYSVREKKQDSRKFAYRNIIKSMRGKCDESWNYQIKLGKRQDNNRKFAYRNVIESMRGKCDES